MVFLRPLAVLGAKWGRARAETSAQATVAIRSAREKLAPLIPHSNVDRSDELI
jgi:hypothetical protein